MEVYAPVPFYIPEPVNFFDAAQHRPFGGLAQQVGMTGRGPATGGA